MSKYFQLNDVKTTFVFSFDLVNVGMVGDDDGSEFYLHVMKFVKREGRE